MLITWWSGHIVWGLCSLAAAWVLFQTGLDIPGQVCAAALILVGMAALLAARALLMFATRATRRHLADWT